MTFTIHTRMPKDTRITAQAATEGWLGRPVYYGTRKVGEVSRVQPVDGGRAVRLTVEQTAEIDILDRSKLRVR